MIYILILAIIFTTKTLMELERRDVVRRQKQFELVMKALEQKAKTEGTFKVGYFEEKK
jgi:hypothetical protein